MTLALWGVPDGSLPVPAGAGAHDPRDAVGFGMNIGSTPSPGSGRGPRSLALNWARFSFNAMDQRERVLDAVDNIKKTALDPYATFRSLYRQHREFADQETRDDNRATVPGMVPAARRTARLHGGPLTGVRPAHAYTPPLPNRDRQPPWCCVRASGHLADRPAERASAFVRTTGDQLVDRERPRQHRGEAGAAAAGHQQCGRRGLGRAVLPRPLLA